MAAKKKVNADGSEKVKGERLPERLCGHCGRQVKFTDNYCPRCGNLLNGNSTFTPAGQSFQPAKKKAASTACETTQEPLHSRTVAALLAFFLGGFGIHNFYLGHYNRAIIQLLLTVLLSVFTCGMSVVAVYIWAFVEGVMILVGSDGYNVDGQGRQLRD